MHEGVFIRNAFHFLPPEKLQALPYNISVGFHPWLLNKIDFKIAHKYLAHASKLKNVMAIGEAGFDNVAHVPLVLQYAFFELQIAIAIQCQRPMIIHCVRAYHLLLPYIKKNNTVIFILHAYSADEGTTKKLLQYENVFFSFGKNMFHRTMIDKQKKLMHMIPLQKLFFENDNSTLQIEKVYEVAASFLKLEMEQLKVETEKNYLDIFKK